MVHTLPFSCSSHTTFASEAKSCRCADGTPCSRSLPCPTSEALIGPIGAVGSSGANPARSLHSSGLLVDWLIPSRTVFAIINAVFLTRKYFIATAIIYAFLGPVFNWIFVHRAREVHKTNTECRVHTPWGRNGGVSTCIAIYL